jgi:hypothetical protein
MVRAGAVDHPPELDGLGLPRAERSASAIPRPRSGRSLRCWHASAEESFQACSEATLTELCATRCRVCDPIWTACVAVGRQEWLEPRGERIVVGKTAIIPAIESPQVTVGGVGSYDLRGSGRQSDRPL